MGAGRRTETVNFNGHSTSAGSSGTKIIPPQRKLAERNRLGSVIFGCTNATYNECVTNKLFGLPYSHHTYVDRIVPGMPLFLFNYTERRMHGIFEAVTEGALNISPYAWTGVEGVRTNYPAQVRVQLRSDFTRIVTLPEAVFREAIKDSYHSPNHFCFEVDNDQTENLTKLFIRSAGSSYRSAAPRSLTNTSQGPIPCKVWKKTNGSGEIDEKLKMKKPATIVISEWEKGAQYFPSSSKDTFQDEKAGSQQQSVWNRRSSNGDEYYSDESEDLQSTYKASEVTSEADLRRIMSNEKVEQEQGLLKFGNGYKPKLNGGSEFQEFTSQDLTVLQNEEERRLVEKLIQLKSVAKESQILQPQLPQGQQLKDGEILVRAISGGTAEWERMARDRSIQEQSLLREEREKLGATLSDLDSSVAMTVKKNLELYAMAIAQMRQDGIELRRILDEARMRPEEQERLAALESANASMATEIRTLKLEVKSFRQRTGDSVLQEKLERTSENIGCEIKKLDLAVIQPPPDIYLIGGLGDQLSRLESVMVWSPSSDRLRTVAPMLTPRCCTGASKLDEHIYVFGGGDGSSWYDTDETCVILLAVERYDRRANQWLSCPPMKTKRGSLGGVAVGDRLFAVGGGNGQVSFSEIESYDPYLGTWLPCTSMFEKRFCVAATELGGALYALGGFDGEQYLMSMERLDPREALWTRMPSMSVKRGSLSTAVLNGKIFALGGYDGDGILDVVETFDPRAGRWDVGQQMCCERAYGAVAVIGEALYYMGGLAGDEAVDSIGGLSAAGGGAGKMPVTLF